MLHQRALHAWARSLASNVAKSGQRVNVIAPGAIDTDILSGDSKEKENKEKLKFQWEDRKSK